VTANWTPFILSFPNILLSFFACFRKTVGLPPATTMVQHHHGLSSGSMVRKHRTMQRQRKYQQRVISWWIKLSVPPMALLLIYYFGTSRFNANNHHEDDNDDDDDNKKKKKKSSTGNIAIWMQNSDAKSCLSDILDRSDGHYPLSLLAGGGGGGGRDAAELVLRQSLVCFSPPVSTSTNNNDNNNKGIVTTVTSTMSSIIIRSVWITGSTAAAGYGNRKQQSYPALVLASSLSSSSSTTTQASGGTISVDVGRDMTEFPLAWCRGTSTSSRRMVLYDFQDDLQHFNITRLRDFVDHVQPTILMVRLSNDHDVDSQREIVNYLQSLVVQEHAPPPLPLPPQQQQGERSSNNSTTLATTTSTTRSVLAVYIIDVSSVVTDDNEKDRNGGGGNGGAVFGVENSPDRLHAHHLTLAQHERVATIVLMLMRHHGFYDNDDDVLDPDKEQEEEEGIDDESAAVVVAATAGTNRAAVPNTHHHSWHCASGFGDATTTGRTPGTLHFVVDDEPSSTSSSSSITLPTVLPDCCGNSMDSVLLPNQELRHLHWMYDALDASAKRRDLPFDQYGFTDWKIVVSGTPQSNALKVVLPVPPSTSSDENGIAAVRQVRVCCVDCDGMIVVSSSSAAVESTLQSVGYGCFDVHPPSATFLISVTSGTCQISHILWQ
jgi:hypothetical protein